MNANTKPESTALQTISAPEETRISVNALMLNPEAMDRVMRMAEMMAGGRCTIPAHLQKNPADCMAVAMQSMQWGMNPFAVAQKTHISPSGALGYEAQLISAVISANAPVKEAAPEYEYIGDWSKVLGKVEERKSDKGGKYYVSTYSKADEVGLGVICRMTLNRESKPREITLMLSQCWPRFSTQWATDPKQQISYAAIRKWSRLYSPGTILGVYAPDELDQAEQPRDMGPVQVVPTSEQGASDELVTAARHAAAQGKAAFAKFWNSTPKDIRPQLRHIRAELDQTAAEFDAKRTVETAPSKQTTQPGRKTLAEVMKMLTDAKTLDALYVAGDWIGDLEDPAERKIAADKFDEVKFTLEME